MKHSTALLFLYAPCVLVSSFTNTQGFIHVSTRRQPLPMPPLKDSLAPLLLHPQQMHDYKDTSVKFDDPITGATEDSSLYMPYDLLPPSVSQKKRVLFLN